MHQLNKVLVIDDDFVTRFLIERELKKSGITRQILTAANGKEALELLKEVCQSEACPELILLDINMPIMNGFEFLELLPSLDIASLPAKIVLLTSSTNLNDREKAKHYPVTMYLSKPLNEEKLHSIMAA